VILEQPAGERFVMLALSRTDERVRAGKTISPGFLFATLLWHDVLVKPLERARRARRAPHPGARAAIDETSTLQTEKLAIQRRFVSGHARDLGPAAALRATDGPQVAASSCWNICASAPAMISCCCAAPPTKFHSTSRTGGRGSRTPAKTSASACCAKRSGARRTRCLASGAATSPSASRSQQRRASSAFHLEADGEPQQTIT
jgi:hypothetical protein